MSFSQEALRTLAQTCADKIKNAREGVEYFKEPYKHVVIDNFLGPELAELCLKNFPKAEDSTWEKMNDTDIEVKARTTWKSEFDIPENIVDAVRILNSSLILNAMADRFEISKIIPDPYFTGGGLNATYRGGLLDVHVDGNYHDASGLNRRLNALVYLNKEWQPSWGGEFGIYDEKGEVCLKKVAPIFNRLVIFDSHDFSFHGLPEPFDCPEDYSRKSIILYYYTKAPRPSEHISVDQPHSALWKKRDLTDKRGNKTRDFK